MIAITIRSSVNVKYVNRILVYRHKEYCRYVWQSCRTSKTASSPPNAVRICSENFIMIFLFFLDTQLASFGFYYQQNFSFVKGVFLKKNEKRVQAERHGFRNRKSWNPGKYKCERGSSVPEAGSHARLPFFVPFRTIKLPALPVCSVNLQIQVASRNLRPYIRVWFTSRTLHRTGGYNDRR